MAKSSEDRLERILAVLLLNQLKGSTLGERALQLSLAGFSNVEIADFLQTSTQTVAQTLYEHRKKKTKRKK